MLLFQEGQEGGLDALDVEDRLLLVPLVLQHSRLVGRDPLLEQGLLGMHPVHFQRQLDVAHPGVTHLRAVHLGTGHTQGHVVVLHVDPLGLGHLVLEQLQGQVDLGQVVALVGRQFDQQTQPIFGRWEGK